MYITRKSLFLVKPEVKFRLEIVDGNRIAIPVIGKKESRRIAEARKYLQVAKNRFEILA